MLSVGAATGAWGEDAERAKRVLMLFSESKDLPANIFLERATRAELQKRSRARLEFYAEHLDASRFPGESHYKLFREYLSEKCGRERPDLVIAFLGLNFALAGELPAKLFPDSPVIFVAVNEIDIPPELRSPKVTGIVQRADIRGTLELILRLQPDTRRIEGATRPPAGLSIWSEGSSDCQARWFHNFKLFWFNRLSHNSR